MNKKKLFWIAFVVLILVFGIIQFVPSPALVVPATLPLEQREAHRLLNFEGIPNFRDLGGYSTTDGRQLKWGRLYRAGSLTNASTEDLANLQKLGLVSIIDFRSTVEKQQEPDRLPEAAGFELIEIPVLDEGNMALARELTERIESGNLGDFDPNQVMLTANRQFANEFTPRFRLFIRAVLAADGAPVLWHCTAGKDRTGFASAILLRILGVPPDVVMRDYMASEQPALEARRNELLMLRLFKGGDTADKVASLLGVDETWLQAAFDEIDATWGDFDSYVIHGLQLGIADVERLRKSLLQ